MADNGDSRWREFTSISMKNTTLWAAVAVIFALFIPAVYFVERQTMFEIVDGLLTGAAIGVMVGYFRAAWHAVRLPSHKLVSADYLVVGVIMIAFFGAIRFAGQWYWRALNKPNWWIDSPTLLMTTIGITIGLFLILMTTSSEKGVLLPKAYLKASWLFALSLSIGAVMIWAGWG